MKKILFVFLLLVFALLVYYFYQGRSFNKQKNIQEIERNILKRDAAGTIEKKESIPETSSFFLQITNPKDNEVVNQSTIIVSGKTLPGAEVFVNDKEAKVDNQGNFSLSVSLDEGENTLVILANDKEGNYQEKELTITLESLE